MMAAGVLGGLAMTALAAAMAFRMSDDIKPGSLPELMGYVGLILFGFITIYTLWRVAATRGPVLTLTQTGIIDTRVAAEEIPWSSVRTLSTWTMHRQKILVLDIDPEVEAGLSLTRIARWSREPNKRLGADGLCVAARGLKIDHDRLAQLCAERIGRARTVVSKGSSAVGGGAV